jgi:phenylacetate-CoA oxygenase PaaJ subunit
VITTTRVWEALASVSDPEYPLSVVDLGMIYDVRVAGRRVEIDMTFTSVGCPAVEMIPEDIREAVRALPDLEDLAINIVWDPPWTKDRISERGRRVLATYGVVA